MVLTRKGTRVKLWARTEEEAKRLNESRENKVLLPGIKFPFRLKVTSSVREALDGADMVILAVPAQNMRHNVNMIRDYLQESMLIVSAAKGLEMETGKRMSEIIVEEIPPFFHPNICALSGPNLAKEIAQGLHAVSVVAAQDLSVAERAQEALSSPSFCVFSNTDMVGVELAGALKNIVALGAGMADGLGYGNNIKAAYITRGLAEITSLGVAMGANALTFAGLAGVGDMVTTCFSPLSRNHYVGVELARGRSLADITSSIPYVAEGIPTTRATRQKARELGVGMPITEAIYQILFENLNTRQAVAKLLEYPAGSELAEIRG
jgi:glycerol-3-phosphate dehydrogenase (NAD(P)+)